MTFVYLLRKKLGRWLLPLRLRLYLHSRRTYKKMTEGNVGSTRRKDELDVLCQIVSPGARVLDIGANVGYYTIRLAAIVGPRGKVFSVEPVPLTRSILQMNLRRSGDGNVEVYPWLLSNENCPMTIVVPPDHSILGYRLGRASICREPSGQSGLKFQQQTQLLDDVDVDLAGVSFVKIDVEGAEVAVLQGMGKFLAANTPTILAEVGNTNHDRVFALLTSLGYKPYLLSGQELHAAGDDLGSDYFFVHSGKLDELRHLVKEPS